MSKYRQEQCQTMLEALDRAGRIGMTRADFAALLNITKGKHLNDLILELVQRDLASVKRINDIHNRKTFFYFSTGASAAEAADHE